MYATTTTTSRDRGDRYGPIEWAQQKVKMLNDSCRMAVAAADAECSDAEEDGDVGVGLIRSGSHHHNVGFRLGLRNVLSERRKRVADYSLGCALFGLLVVVVETEMSLAQLYDKVSHSL